MRIRALVDFVESRLQQHQHETPSIFAIRDHASHDD